MIERRRGERRRGRPSLASGTTPPADVHVTLRPEDYDNIDAIARRERKSVPQVIREAITRLIASDRSRSVNLET